MFTSQGDSEAMRASLTAEIPMRRIGTIEDVAHAVAMLVSPRGRYITGITIAVDGGLLRSVR